MSKVLATAVLALLVGTSTFALAGDTATEVKTQTTVENGVATTTTQAAEAVGEKVEEGTAAAGQAVENAGAEVKQAGEAAAEKVEQAADKTGEALENAGEKVEAAAETTGEKVEQTITEAATDADGKPVAETAAAGATTFERPTINFEGYQDVSTALVAEEIDGARLYDVQDNDIGEVGDLVMAADGTTIEMIVLDVGGFLGIGEHEVAVSPDQLQFLKGEQGDVRVYIAASQEQLEALPEYEAPAAQPIEQPVEQPATEPSVDQPVENTAPATE